MQTRLACDACLFLVFAVVQPEVYHMQRFGNVAHLMEMLWHRIMGEPWLSKRPNVTLLYPGGVPWLPESELMSDQFKAFQEP